MATPSDPRDQDALARDEWRRLFIAHSDQSITAEEHRRLEELLSQSEAARSDWFLHCDLELGIAEWATRSTYADEPLPTAESSRPVPATTSRKPTSQTFTPLFAILVAASVLMLVGSFWLWPEQEPMVQGVAVLSRTVDVEWADSRDAKWPGAPLAAGPLRIKSGALLVEFYSGARVVVEGPAELSLVSASEAFLISGRINAHVPPQASGFTVQTSHFEVIDLGTDFGLTVTLQEGEPKAEVHVFNGLIKVAPMHSRGDEHSLKTGEAIKLDETTFVPIPPDRSAFLQEKELIERENAFSQNRRTQWAESTRLLQTDRSLVLHFPFEESGGLERTALQDQRTIKGAPDSIGQMIGCKWTTGRWPNKRALAFRQEGDRIRFTVPQPMEQVTLMTWVRIDSLKHGITSLLTADDERSGALRWEITSNGCLRLGIGRDLNQGRVDWEAVNSVPVLLPENYGQWLCLVTTFDGSVVRHFVNGKACGEGAAFRPSYLHIGTAEIGNWRGQSVRNLDGSIDDFVILSRPLSANEIQDLWQRGKP